LTVSWFQNLFDARRKIAAWRKDYNEERPHSSLGYKTPKEFAAAEAAGFYRAELGQGDSNAVPLPQTPIPAQTRDGANGVCLDKLKAEDLVHVERESTFLHYTANTEALQELLQFLYAECCTRNKAVKPDQIIQICK
jgi:Integrase core domain